MRANFGRSLCFLTALVVAMVCLVIAPTTGKASYLDKELAEVEPPQSRPEIFGKSEGGSLVIVANHVLGKLGSVCIRELDDLRFHVNVTIVGEGSIVIDPNQEDFASGERVRVLAIPDPGHNFAGWSGDVTGTQNPADFEIISDMEITATFVPKPPAILTLHTTGDGTVIVDPLKDEYEWNDQVTLTAIPAAGSIFVKWQGDLSGSTNPAAITMDADKEITAVFIPKSLVTPISDDFHSCSLDTSIWSLLNPAGDGSVQMTGTAIEFEIPAGVGHNLWLPNSDAVRIMQPTEDQSFEIEAKFNSLPVEEVQLEGVLVQQDGDNWLRFGFYHDGTSLFADAARTNAGASSSIKTTAIDPAGAQSLTIRIARNGDLWTHAYSLNGSEWTTHVVFTQALNVSQTGLYAGNAAGTPGSEPAFTAQADYFMNTAVPVGNSGPSAITISKSSEPVSTTPFDFSGDLGQFSLRHGESHTSDNLCETSYQVIEAGKSGWVLHGVACDSEQVTTTGSGVSIHLQAGKHVSCTFSNKRTVVVADAGGPYIGIEGTAVLLDASGSSNQDLIKTYRWDCTGDGVVDHTSAIPTGSTCTYLDNGVYTLKLTTVDTLNRTSSDVAQVSITNMVPMVDAGSDQVVTAGTEAHFAGSFSDPGSLDTHTIMWNFGDGSIKSGTLLPRHTYPYSGTYTVTLTVADDDGGIGLDTLLVDVLNRPPTLSNISVNPSEINEGDTYILSGSMSDTTPAAQLNLFVDWGDGQVTNHAFMPGCTTFSLVHHCLDDAGDGMGGGAMIIKLKLSDEEGAFSTATAEIKVNNIAPVVNAGPDRRANLSHSITFTALVSDPGANDTHVITWDFGDGTPVLTGESVNHRFARAGMYTVTVTAEDDDGGLGVDSFKVTVRAFANMPVIMKP